MTAFSNAELTDKEVTLSWEIRTVNHRYLDISLHLPEAFSPYENSLKETIRKKLGRGKLDAKLTYKAKSAEDNNKIQIDEIKVKALLSARKKLEGLLKIPLNMSAIDVLQWPGVIEGKHQRDNDNVGLVKDLLKTTLDDLIKMRELEGGRLSVLIITRCNVVTAIIKKVRLRRVEVQAGLREKVLKKIAEIDVIADTNRLEQELVYQAQRLDVDEELDRLGSHIEEVQAVSKRNEPVGRRLDFLMQELNREANTLASKSNDSETTRSAVELKVLIEQMREQVMNIE